MVLLFVTVISPILLYTDRLGTFQSSNGSTCKNPFQFFSAFSLPLISSHKQLLGLFSAAIDGIVDDVATFVSSIFMIFSFSVSFFNSKIKR